jgi:anaerobic selenocysteine-containing dehydrogenase
MLGTMRSHDQFNTSIYSDNDRYRGVKNIRTIILMNEEDMGERGLKEFDFIDITSFAKDGTTRSMKGFRATKYNIPKGCAQGYMPELNALIGIGNYSEQSDQPMMKQLLVEIKASDVKTDEIPPSDIKGSEVKESDSKKREVRASEVKAGAKSGAS